MSNYPGVYGLDNPAINYTIPTSVIFLSMLYFIYFNNLFYDVIIRVFYVTLNPLWNNTEHNQQVPKLFLKT